MSVKLLYFAGLRESLGCGAESIDLPPEVGDVASLRACLVARGGVWQALANTGGLRVAVNQAMATPATAVADGDEVAFFPPVTGG